MVDGSRREAVNIFDRRCPSFVRFSDASLGNVESDGKVFERDGLRSSRVGRVASSPPQSTGRVGCPQMWGEPTVQARTVPGSCRERSGERPGGAAPRLRRGRADLILEVGPQRLMQVGFETSPGSDLVQRMLDYRSRIMYRHPGYHLTQYIVVLGSGLVTGFDDLERLGFALQVKVVYLRDCDPQEFLGNPAMGSVRRAGSRFSGGTGAVAEGGVATDQRQ